MKDADSKFRLKIGALEIEYEGDSSFLQDGIFNVLDKTASFYAAHKDVISADPPADPPGGASGGGATQTLSLTTGAIAARLKATSGPELAIAAAANLALVQNKDKFSRKEINDAMKTATSYYKSNMSGNLTSSLETLVKNNRLNEVSSGVYALHATELKSLEGRLAQ